MAVPLKLPRIPSGLPIVDPRTGAATDVFQLWFQQFAEGIEQSINGIQTALEAAGIALDAADVAIAAAVAAQDAADNAQVVTDTQIKEQNIVNSGTQNPSPPPLLSADSTGNVTIANHERRYGDGTVVSVSGNTVSTGVLSGDTVYIFYDDPTRTGGAVLYQSSSSADDAVQSGARHSVGAVAIPNTGTQDGRDVLPPGVVYI